MNKEADKRRDLDDKGLSQNKMHYSSSDVKLPLFRLPDAAKKTDLQLPASFWLLKPHWLEFFPIASFLSPLFCRLIWRAS